MISSPLQINCQDISKPISTPVSIARGGLRKNELQNRKTAIRAFFCMGKNRMETGPIIVNGQILPSKNGFENCHF